jgi:RNA polymerase sigma-70 factor (ECF subfamily)
MAPASTDTTAHEQTLLQRARAGDEAAFSRLIEPRRGELHAHCYRMLGSVHDAEDALQDAMLRAWRGMKRFEGRSSLRSWLYTIATNACLDQIARRPKRVLPIDYGPATDPHVAPGEPLVESVWIEPYPDEVLGIEDGFDAPAASYERREGVELAFIAALQHLPATQRAVLILREVLGFSAKEVAEALETTVAAVNSALQRARAAVEERVPDQSQQATLRTLGDDAVRELVDRYVDAWERNDVEAFAAMLAEDATFAMPPLASWYRGREAITQWAVGWPLSGTWRWRALRTTANGQLALGFYAWNAEDGNHRPFALNVLSLRGDQVSDVTAFIARAPEAPAPEAFERYPDEPVDAARVEDVFARFGLPTRPTDAPRSANVLLHGCRDPDPVGVRDGLGAVTKSGLGEQVIDVRLHRGRAHEEALGDLGVGQARGDEAENLALARRQTVRELVLVLGAGVVAARAAGAGRKRRHHVMLHGGVERGLAGGHGEDGRADVLGAGILGQVAAGSGAQRAEHALVVGEGGEGDDARAGEPIAQRLGGGDPVHARHAQVHEHDIGLMDQGERDRLLPVRSAGHELDATQQPEQRRQALAHESLVVGEENPDRRVAGNRRRHAGSSSCTRKPSSVGSATSVPPRSSARSRIPVSP